MRRHVHGTSAECVSHPGTLPPPPQSPVFTHKKRSCCCHLQLFAGWRSAPDRCSCRPLGRPWLSDVAESSGRWPRRPNHPQKNTVWQTRSAIGGFGRYLQGSRYKRCFSIGRAIRSHANSRDWKCLFIFFSFLSDYNKCQFGVCPILYLTWH